MLRTRLVTAACIIVPLLALVWADTWWNLEHPGIWLFPVALLLWFLAAGELREMMAERDGAMPAVGYFASLAPVFLAPGVFVYWPLVVGPRPPDCPLGYFGWPILGMTLAVGMAFAWEMWRFRPGDGQATRRLTSTLFAGCYLGIPFAFLVALRIQEGNRWGIVALLSLLVIVKMSDAGAYGAGRLWGKRRLAPQLSPNKTVEGAVGGILVAAVTAILFRGTVAPWIVAGDVAPSGDVIAWGTYGALLAVAAMGGDLGESLIKRDLGCKDSSRWLPGLGGILDLVDSILFAAPVAYFCWVAGLVGPS